MIKSVLITGANSGLGKECARQMALLDGVERFIWDVAMRSGLKRLSCRWSK